MDATGPDGKFSAMPLTPASPVVLGASGAQVFDTGIEWTELDNADLGTTGSITWTVACAEVPPPPQPVTYVSSVLNFSGTGWGGWSCGAGETIVSATWQDLSGGAVDLIVGLAKPGVTTDGSTYPYYPHYNFTPPEEGAVAHNISGTGGQATLTLVCQP